jgi:hypothetical protein
MEKPQSTQYLPSEKKIFKKKKFFNRDKFQLKKVFCFQISHANPLQLLYPTVQYFSTMTSYAFFIKKLQRRLDKSQKKQSQVSVHQRLDGLGDKKAEIS